MNPFSIFGRTRPLLFAALLLTACSEVPKGADARSDAADAIAERPGMPVSVGEGHQSGIVDDTLRTPAIVEPGARAIIDQMIADYQGYVDVYRKLAQNSETDMRAFVQADSLLHHAENVYAGLVDAMELNSFSSIQRRRLDTAKARFDRLAKKHYATPRPKRTPTPHY